MSRTRPPGRRTLVPLVLLALCAATAGCVFMPRGGTPVFVERRAGDFWSGEGRLLEVSPDGRRCRVAIRVRAGFVERRWMDCRYVHERLGARR